MKWRCRACGWIYDEAEGLPEQRVSPGTSFEDLPLGWTCPICGAPKEEFERVE